MRKDELKRRHRAEIIGSIAERLEQRWLMSGSSISGTVFVDANHNGVQDKGEAGLPNINVYNDTSSAGTDSNIASTTTDKNGHYLLSQLNAGKYKIRELPLRGWTQTVPANNFGWTITLGTNQSMTGKNFGKESPSGGNGEISGRVYHDVNGDAKQSVGEVGLSDVTVYDDLNNNGIQDPTEQATLTDANGDYTLFGLGAGEHKIREFVYSFYGKQTAPANGFGWTQWLAADQVQAGKNFGQQYFTDQAPPAAGSVIISGDVFNDANGNGKVESGEAGLSAWTVYIDSNNNGVFDTGELSELTRQNGSYLFSGLAAGSYILRAIRPAGWVQTTPINNLGQHVTVVANEIKSNVVFGERQIG